MKKLFFFLAIVLTHLKIYAQRTEETINDNWSFSISDEQSYSSKDFDDQKWALVNLPHTWNTDAYSKKDYFRGNCWYRKRLMIPERLKTKEIFIRFEAVNSQAELFINGKEKLFTLEVIMHLLLILPMTLTLASTILLRLKLITKTRIYHLCPETLPFLGAFTGMFGLSPQKNNILTYLTTVLTGFMYQHRWFLMNLPNLT